MKPEALKEVGYGQQQRSQQNGKKQRYNNSLRDIKQRAEHGQVEQVEGEFL